MFVLKKKKPNKKNKSIFSTSNNGLSKSEKRDLTKKAHEKALELKRIKEIKINKKSDKVKKEKVGLWGIIVGSLTYIEGLGKVCGAAAVPVPALIGLGVLVIAASIGYWWLGT